MPWGIRQQLAAAAGDIFGTDDGDEDEAAEDEAMEGNVTIGPVVGLVTADTARVLFEFQFNGRVRVVLRGGDGSSAKCRRVVSANRPVTFAFAGLTPGETYDIVLPPKVACGQAGRFHTFTGSVGDGPLRAAVVTCNKLRVVQGLGGRDLWCDLGRRAEGGELDVILHLGDQIYADELDVGIEGGDPNSVFNRMLQVLHAPGGGSWSEDGQWASGGQWVANEGEVKERMTELGRGDATYVLEGELLPADQWEDFRAQITEEYRQLYRDTWGHPSIRHTLAHCSSCMILDDHDVSDDWGDRHFHRDPDGPEWFIGTIALQVYWEYQRSLRQDMSVGSPACAPFEHEGWAVRWGDVAALFVDMRGPRSFRCPDDMRGMGQEPPLVCDDQWAMIEGKLAEWGDVRYVLFCTPVPPVLFSAQMTQLGAQFVNDCAGQFAFGQSDALVRLLDVLRGWKEEGADAGRDVGILCGDIHIGWHTDIQYGGATALRQLIASSVGNHGAGAQGLAAMAALGHVQHEIGGGWTFTHHGMVTAERNFGVVALSAEGMGFAHVQSDDGEGGIMGVVGGAQGFLSSLGVT